MADIIKCPNCGASDAEKKSETEYVCNYCESQFIVGQKKKQTTVDDALKQMYQIKSQTNYSSTAKPMRMVGLMIAISALALIIGIAVFVANTVNTAIENVPGKMAADDYWNEGSPYKFYIFEGEKGPMCWILINQSSKHLDSAKYTIQLVDPQKDKLKMENHFMSMAWSESFNFNNYLSEMVCEGNKVYFLSDANGINCYDLYSGKRLQSNEEFAALFPELKSGIVSAKNVYYRNAIELMTNDGFKFYFFPKYNELVSEVDFNDYQKTQAFIGGFVVSGEPRQKLYYVISKQDTLRNDFSFSDYYLNEYLQNGKSGKNKDKAFAVDTAQTFFNVNFLIQNRNQVVLVYTEKVAKDSPAYIVSYSKDNYDKYLWKIELNSIKGFEKAVKDGYYLRKSCTNDELAVWYESANKIGFGIDLSSGKINWNYSLD